MITRLSIPIVRSDQTLPPRSAFVHVTDPHQADDTNRCRTERAHIDVVGYLEPGHPKLDKKEVLTRSGRLGARVFAVTEALAIWKVRGFVSNALKHQTKVLPNPPTK